jgi:hypothetical protein
MITLRAINDSGVKVDLDVMDVNQPLKLDISAIENSTIGSVFGVSSQTFSLPGTDKNNQFFGNLFDLGVDGAVALQNSIDCQLLTDGQQVFNGKLYITDIITDQKGYTTYQVNLVNETVDLKFSLENTLLRELDWSDYNHAYTYGNITSSWDFNLLSGDVIYPHVNYGAPEGDTRAPEWTFSNNINGAGFDVVGNANSRPLRVLDFKPAIRAKAVLDNIFSSVGYQYTSSFFDSSYFDKLYVIATSTEALGVSNENPITGSYWAYRNTNQVFNALTDTKIGFPLEVFDNLGAYNTSTSQYTAYAGGGHYFALGFTYAISNYGVNNRIRFRVSLQDNLGNVEASRVFVDPPQSGQLYVPFITSLNVNQIVEVHLELISDIGNEQVTISGGQNNTYFRLVQGPDAVVGSSTNVNIGAQFPEDLTAIDFLDGLIQKFNLVIEPIPGQRNTLRIEPFQDWIDLGEVKDWTDKVDRNTRMQISHPISEQPKTIIFRDEDDEAAINKYNKDNFGDVFGTYVFNNDSDLAQGERTIGKVFAALPVKNIPLSRDFIIPTLARQEPGERERPFKFKPRLVYANGKKDVGVEAYGYSAGGSTNLPQGWVRGTYFMRDENQLDHRLSDWFQVSTLSDIPSDFDSTTDLHFGNNKLPGWYQYFQPTGINGKTKNGAFHTYWETYINSLYDIDARKLTCNVWLQPTEIQDIALNNKIFIDGHYYRINRIGGANITEEESVEVELIKQLNRKLVYPRRRVTVGTATLDLQISDENVNGTVTYIDYNTGDIVYDVGFVSQVGVKDGYQVYEGGGTGSAIWDYKPQVNIPLEKSVLGTNDVSSEAGRVSVIGQNNTIDQQVSEATILGTDNSIGTFTDTTFISGKRNIIDIDQSNLSIVGSNQNTMENGTNDSVIIGGGSNSIHNSSIVTIVGGVNNVVSSSVTSRNVVLGGLNGVIDASIDTVTVNNNGSTFTSGSGHTIIGDVDSLDLSDYANQSNIVGATYHWGSEYYRVGDLLISQTGSIDLQDPSLINIPVFALSYTDAGTGPGHGTIYLPAIRNTSNDKTMEGRTYTIFGINLPTASSKTVRLRPSTNDTTGLNPVTISGQSYVEAATPYGSIKVIAHSNQWYIIGINN